MLQLNVLLRLSAITVHIHPAMAKNGHYHIICVLWSCSTSSALVRIYHYILIQKPKTAFKSFECARHSCLRGGGEERTESGCAQMIAKF